MLTLLSSGPSLRMLNCVLFSQSREQRYIVVIYGILMITFSYRLHEVFINYFVQLQLRGALN